MKMNTSTSTRVMAALAGGSMLAAMSALPAAAADGNGVEVVNTETVQAYTDATGEVQSKRIYEQLALTGSGPVDLTNPVVTDGLRNLDGFGGFDVEDGQQVVKVDVDGEKNLRSVSNYDGDMPLDISASYVLDGKEVDPGDVVGKSGVLTVTYTVKNVTQKLQTITFPDGKGGTMSREVEVMMPMVGSLETTLPSTFRDIQSDANMAGDGQGGTRLNYTMTLLAPIGSDTAELGYTARVTDAVVPDASVSALPVNPLDVPSFKSAGSSYRSGAESGEELANGAATIDENLLKLRDGAAELLAGMIQLRDGAGELNKGLADTAVPGAMKLAAGAGELHTGMGRLYAGTVQLSDGSNQLADGAGQLAVGSKTAYQGSQKLTDGLGLISGGLDTLAGKLPGAQEGIALLQDGVDQLTAGLGDPSNAETLIGGLTAIQNGLATLQNGQGALVGGLQQLAGPEGLGKIKAGAQLLKTSIDGAGPVAAQNLDALIALANSLATDPACTGSCQVTGAKLAGGLVLFKKSLTDQLTLASGGTAQIIAGLDQAIGGVTGQLLPGANLIYGGLGSAKDGAGDAIVGANKLREGTIKVRGGLDQLAQGMTDAVAGVLQLANGADDAYAGSGELTDGLGKISSGAGQVADGADRLADGAGQLKDGTGTALDGAGQIADGNQQLADGLGDAADGSGLIFDGLVQAALGVPKIRDGAQELSDKGSKKLVDAGLSTAQEYGQMYAMLEAGGKRADASKMVVGAPKDAIGLAAYSYEIQGEDGEGGRNLSRGLAGLVVLGAGAGAFALRRRFV